MSVNRKKYDISPETHVRILGSFELVDFSIRAGVTLEQGDVLVVQEKKDTSSSGDEMVVLKCRSNGRTVTVSYRNLETKIQRGKAEIIE